MQKHIDGGQVHRKEAQRELETTVQSFMVLQLASIMKKEEGDNATSTGIDIKSELHLPMVEERYPSTSIDSNLSAVQVAADDRSAGAAGGRYDSEKLFRPIQ